MTDKEISDLGDLDLYLEDIIDGPPSADLTNDFKPWRKAMNRILWGIVLTTITLNFWNLDWILPAIGQILLVLGFRALRNENKWFKIAYVTSWIRTIWWLIAFATHVSVYSGEPEVSVFLTTGSYLMLVPEFLMLVCLRNGIRTIQTKVGLPAHGGNGILVWDLIITVLGFINISGITVWGLLIAYIFILRNLYMLSGELDEAGYAVCPASVKISDNAVKLIYVGVIALAMVIGYGFFNKYFMDWQPIERSGDSTVQEVRQELIDLGFPEYVLDDMTDEEILACDGAIFVLVAHRDYDMDQCQGIGTQEEINNGLVEFVTEDEAERQLRTTYVGIQFGDEPERWQIIHHFEWLIDTNFCGTEAIQMWPYSETGWNVTSDFTGRLLYDLEGTTYTSDYHSLGRVSYETTDLAAQMLGQTTSNDVFATFSMPNQGSNKRGYVMYELSEVIDGCIVSSWFNYIHQHSQFQFPVQTAMEFEMTSFINDGLVFQMIQTALQFTTHGEIPELF